MGADQTKKDYIKCLEECLARLKQELIALDQLGSAMAAVKVSEACDTLAEEIRKLRGPPMYN